MADQFIVHINGQSVEARTGQTVAALLMCESHNRFRRSVTGQPRAPLCAMGICFECRVRLNGLSQQLACMTMVKPGMEIETDA